MQSIRKPHHDEKQNVLSSFQNSRRVPQDTKRCHETKEQVNKILRMCRHMYNQKSFSQPVLRNSLVCCSTSISLQRSSFIGLQEVKSKVSSYSLRQCDPWKWFVAATIPLSSLPTFFKALVWPVAGGYWEEVSGQEMGNWALMRNNETLVGEITGKEGLAEQIGGWAYTYISADTENPASSGGVDVTAVRFYLNTHYFLHHVHGKKKHLLPPQGCTGTGHIVPHNQRLIEI